MSLGLLELLVELVLQLLAELVVPAASIAIGAVLGSVIFLVVRAVRRSLRGLDRTREFQDPEGRTWQATVEVVPGPARWPVSTKVFGMGRDSRERRRREGATESDQVLRGELLHPVGLIEKTDEAAGFLATALLVAIVAATALFVVEVVLVLLVAVITVTVRALRRSWLCAVVDPRGTKHFYEAESFDAARDRRDELVQQIQAGVLRIDGQSDL